MVTSSSDFNKEEADLVIINGKVLTIDKNNPTAEAIAVKGEKIIAVGTSSQISRMIAEGRTKVIDAAGRLVIPGFNDAHVHFGPLDPDYIELRYTSDPAVITEKVMAKIAKLKKTVKWFSLELALNAIKPTAIKPRTKETIDHSQNPCFRGIVAYGNINKVCKGVF